MRVYIDIFNNKLMSKLKRLMNARWVDNLNFFFFNKNRVRFHGFTHVFDSRIRELDSNLNNCR